MKVIIIGNGMVGYKFAEKLVAKAPGVFDIEIFGEESRPAYDRVHLSSYFEGKSADDRSLAPTACYFSHNMILHLADPVQSIDPLNITILSHRGLTASYDYL